MNIVTKTIALVSLVVATVASQAGTFRQIESPSPRVAAYVYSGTVAQGDERAYGQLLSRHEELIIVIDSPGGNLLAGIQMGQLTRQNDQRVTLVAKQAYSAAGMFWLGDSQPKFLDEESEVGLHLAFSDDPKVNDAFDQTVGYMIGKYFEQMLGDADVAFKLMERLSVMRYDHGRNAMLILTADGKTGIRR
ncbi:MAG: hypothetical protein MUC92_13300 [Fimbriimonadaceae bacterium]|jgi:hypothetical protein|nr:hypothetical protein [Fimbriimonadaceae bacterium]